MSNQFHNQPTSGQYGQGEQTRQQGMGDQQSRMGGGMQQPQMQQPQTQGSEMRQPQMQQSRTGTGGGQRMQQGTHQGSARHFEDHLTNELRIVLEDFNEVSHVAEWCATECTRAGPQMADCARICTDIAELAELNERWIARDSMFGPDIAEQFIQIATEALPELEQHQQAHPHVTETIHTIDRAIESCRTVLQMTGQGAGSQQGMGGGQHMGSQQQMGGQQMGGRQPMGGQQF